MDWLIWTGSAIALAGLLGLVWCVWQALRARREGLTDTVLRERLQRLVAINLAALGLSALGLMIVIVGIALA